MSSTDSQDERTVYSKGKKLKRTTKSMTLVLSDEEAKYRKQNFKNVDVIADYSDKLQCTRCFISIKSAVIEGRDIFCHPLLKVLMCKKCIDFYGSGEFSLDEDDEDKYCRWCGQGGTLLVCSKCICGFCPKCIQKHFGKEKKKQVEKDDDWICFFCKPDWLFDLRAICALAVEASNKNRKELRGKRESRLLAMKGKASTSRSRPKRNTRGSSPSTSTSEKGNTSEPNEIEIISSSDEHEKTDKEAAAEKGKAKDKDRDGEREKSKTPKIVLKRKRGCKIMMACKANGKAYGVDTSSEGTSGETRGRKKLRTSLTACDVKPKEKKEISPKKKLDSDSSSSENEEDPPAATISAPSKQVTKSLNKLTDLFKLTEMTSQLCYNVCKKHIKKLENKNTVITNEKLIKESEKLKTVLTMLSTNLNTVSSTVSSLQNKLGVDVAEQIRRWEKEMEFYFDKLKLEYTRMVLEYAAEKDAKKVQKLNGMSKPPEVEQSSITRDIDIESTLTDEGEETTSSSRSEGDSDGDNASVQESSREGEDSSSSTVIYEREKDESSEKTKNENESSEDVGEDNGTEEDVEETNQTSENGGETNRKSEDDSSIIGTQSQLVKTLEEVLDVEMKEDTAKEDSKKEDEAAKEEASTDEDGTRQSQLVKVLKELSEVEANKEDTAEEVTKKGNEAAEEVDSVDEISDSDNDFRIKICKRPDTFLKVMKKDLIAEIQKDLLEDLIELDRTKEDDVNTDKFIESIENSLKPKRNDEDVDIFEEKERSSNSTASGIVSQEVLVEDKEKGSFSDGSQTLTADSKTLVHESQSLLQSEDTDKKYSKVLEIKKTVLASSSDEDDSSQEDSGEPASETEESESEEESKESDSEMETGKKKTKKTVRNSEKRKRFDSSDGSSDKEEKELNKLTNLNTLKRRKLIFDSTEDEDEEEETAKEKSKATPKNTEKKSKQKSPVETLLDMYSDSSSSESKAEKKANEEEEETDPMNFVWKNTLPTIKSLVLATSDSSSDDSFTSEEESKKEEKPKEEPKKEKKKYQQNKKPSWKNDPLLRDELSSEEEQRRWKEKQQKKLSSPPVVEIVSDSSDADNFRPSATEKKKKRKRHDIKISDVSSSESEVEQHTPVKSQDTPSKGRKNIKKILKKDSLLLETRQALRAETERKKRLAARNKMYNELFAKDDKQLVLDFDPQTKKPLLKVDKALVAHLKPHQREGVKFMWDCCFESLKRLEEDSGSGCILAHCMGLGKTLQAVTLVHTLLNNDTGVQTVLIVCPLNTVSNWQNEFVIWLKNLNGKKIRVFAVNQFNKHFQRSETLQSWQRDGGVMIISYEMFRRLTGALKQSPHKKHGPVYEKTLLDPGPDLVICDEGHKIKNQETALSKNMRKIKTLRRVILTGTPLQNNLKEYYWMVNFVKPNILGSKKEFNNRFINPIHNGQFKDSTVLDVKIMKKRSHVLHSMLDGCIQRINYDIASPYLPEKHEYVIYICLTETQAKLYDYYLHQFSKRGLEKVKSASLFNDFHSLQRVCTHPQVLRNYAKKPNEEEETAPPPKTQTPSIEKFFTPSVTTGSTDEVATNLTNLNGAVLTPAAPLDLPSSSKPQIPVDWWKGMVEEREFEDPYASGKLCLLWSILEYCQKIGDKLLVFSQSLQTLNLIEYFLKKLNESGAETWIENLDYFKLTGSTSLENRTKACKKFNKSDNQRGRLFLISTRAGGLGINLIAANRVIIFDASWNPSHDVQSIFRVYRFGQEKTCYIYRFLAEATMEEKIYDRQITKLSLSDRVVDEHQIERHFTLGNLTELYNYEPIPPDQWETPMVPKDLLLAEILAAHKDIIVRVLEHDSLLENKEEEELTEEERQAAWEEFEKEKFADNRGIASPLANSNSNVQPGASPVAYNGSVLDMLDILKNTTGNTSPGPSVVPNPFANGGSPSRRLPGSAPSSPVTKTPAATPAINFSNETMAQRSEPNGTEQNSLADASPTTPPRNANLADTPPSVSDSAHAGSSKNETQFSNEDALDHVLRMGTLLDLPLNEGEKIEDYRTRVCLRLDELKLPDSVLQKALEY